MIARQTPPPPRPRRRRGSPARTDGPYAPPAAARTRARARRCCRPARPRSPDAPRAADRTVNTRARERRAMQKGQRCARQSVCQRWARLKPMEFETGAQRSAFDEWVDMMRGLHRELDVTPDPAVTLTAKFADSVPAEIGFGRYAGHRRWQRIADIPAPEIKDELLRLIVWQGDSEVRAVEQARELLDSAPTEHDRTRLARHMTEETRHGWQMAYLLVTHFGDAGRAAARELLERRATRGEALLELFNGTRNGVDRFSWHNWGDRAGKYPLTVFPGSRFA